MANYIPHFDLGSCEFLNLRLLLRSQPCIHCGSRESLKAHGFLRSSNHIIRGIRFYCSGRDSNQGCGKTFSIHFEESLPNSSLTAHQADEIITSKHQPLDTKKTPTGKEITKSTRSRWLKKFDLSQHYIRAQLYCIDGPDKKAKGDRQHRQPTRAHLPDKADAPYRVVFSIDVLSLWLCLQKSRGLGLAPVKLQAPS